MTIWAFNQINLAKNDGSFIKDMNTCSDLSFDFNVVLPEPIGKRDTNWREENWHTRSNANVDMVSEYIIEFRTINNPALPVAVAFMEKFNLTGNYCYISECLQDWGVLFFKKGKLISTDKNKIKDQCRICNAAFPYSPVERLKPNNPDFCKQIALSFLYLNNLNESGWSFKDVNPTHVILIVENKEHHFSWDDMKLKATYYSDSNPVKSTKLDLSMYIDEQLETLWD